MKAISIFILTLIYFIPKANAQQDQQARFLAAANVRLVETYLNNISDSVPSDPALSMREFYNRKGFREKTIIYDIYGDSISYNYLYRDDSIQVQGIKYINGELHAYSRYIFDKNERLEEIVEYNSKWEKTGNSTKWRYGKNKKPRKEINYSNSRICRIDEFEYDSDSRLEYKIWRGSKAVEISRKHYKDSDMHFKSINSDGIETQTDRVFYNKTVGLSLFNGHTKVSAGQTVEHRSVYNKNKLIDFQEEFLDGVMIGRKEYRYIVF